MSKKREKIRLHPESIRILNGVIEAFSIPENAIYYDQNVIADPLIDGFPECGTVCCIAGQAYYNEFGEDNYIHLVKNGDQDLMMEWVRENMMDDEGKIVETNLFNDINTWPEKYRNAYLDAKNPIQRAKVAIKAIEEFKQNADFL